MVVSRELLAQFLTNCFFSVARTFRIILHPITPFYIVKISDSLSSECYLTIFANFWSFLTFDSPLVSYVLSGFKNIRLLR